MEGLKNQLQLLEVNIDPNCAKWLSTNIDGTLNAKIDGLKLGVFDAVQDAVTGKWLGDTVGAVAGDAGYDILAPSSGLGDGTPSSLRTMVFKKLVHELAHLFKAPDFQNGDGALDENGNLTPDALARQSTNAALIETNCGGTIH